MNQSAMEVLRKLANDDPQIIKEVSAGLDMLNATPEEINTAVAKAVVYKILSDYIPEERNLDDAWQEVTEAVRFSLVAQPTCDAAEGGDKCTFPDCRCIDATPCPHYRHSPAATPQPAPDAMREAGTRLWNAAKAVALYRPLAKTVCHVPAVLMHELIDALVFSSAPVLPADGAGDQIIGQIEERFPNWKSYRDLIDCIDVTLHELRVGLSWAGPSGTGAAEPVALADALEKSDWSNTSIGNKALIRNAIITLRGTPPVRGDREAIAITLLHMNALEVWNSSLLWAKDMVERRSDQSHTNDCEGHSCGCVRCHIDHAIACADAILSLRVQPSAGDT